jgi:hypothetical protein
MSNPTRRKTVVWLGLAKGLRLFFAVMFCLALWSHDLLVAGVFVVGYLVNDLQVQVETEELNPS